MSNRKNILIIILILAVIALGVFILIKIKGKPNLVANVINEPLIEKTKNQDESPASNSQERAAAPSSLDENERLKLELSKTASYFAERFGTYSVGNNFENFSDLKPFMTEEMSRWTDNYINEMKGGLGKSFGIISRKVKFLIIEDDQTDLSKKDKIEALISLQRQETTPGQEKVYNQDIRLQLAKDNGQWKINKAEWK